MSSPALEVNVNSEPIEVVLATPDKTLKAILVGDYTEESNHVFRLANKQSQPEPIQFGGEPPPVSPYSGEPRVNLYVNADPKSLQVNFIGGHQIVTSDGGTPVDSLVLHRVSKPILEHERNFSLILCTSPSERLSKEIGLLVHPFFYQDSQHAFFIEPTLFEKTTDEWQEWIIHTPTTNPDQETDEYLQYIPIYASVPSPESPVSTDASDPSLIDPDPRARFVMGSGRDWLLETNTVIQFDDVLVGQDGGIEVESMLVDEDSEDYGGEIYMVSGDLRTSGRAGKIGDPARLGTLSPDAELTIIGTSGLNADVIDSINVLRGLNMARGETVLKLSR